MGTYEYYEMLRNSRGLRNSDVSKATGIAKSTFTEWKNGKYELKVDKMVKIAEFFGCDLEEFYGFKKATKEEISKIKIPVQYSVELGELVSIFTSLNDEDKQYLLRTARMLKK